MRSLRRTRFLIVNLVGVMTGCNLVSPSEQPSPYFNATLVGAVQSTYVGNGEFSTGTYSPELRVFNLQSTNEDGDETFGFHLYRTGVPGSPGQYAVTLFRGLSPGAVLAQYFRVREDGVEEQYVGEAGTITIETSTPKWVEGTFRFSGVRYCERGPGVDGYCPLLDSFPNPVPDDLPRIEVTGSFGATPWDNFVEVGCDPICSDGG